ncbi:MAG: hypothetical protein LIO54_08485 [Oscillospiraceae bacterium]|nr:hypothetical protein [Oscillospiraceae bacterium]
MAFWTDTFMDKMRTEWLRRIAKVQYYAGGTWYDAQITEKSIDGDNIKLLTATTDSAALTITSVRLIDIAGDVAGQLSESITKTASQGVVTLWEFPLYEVT